MFGQDREQLRRFFSTSWTKRQQGEPLQPLEQLVVQVIEQHPEYHGHLADDDQLQRDFTPEQGQTNPWLHMGMHISLAEQLGADRPPGIRSLYQNITARHGDPHKAEHAMMDCLGLVLWEAQRANRAPDETAYLECLKKLEV
ncbi:MAG: DUF1841 family protein [Gammaproteobacteria bacterium]|nr:DUF1841 family protein [Gammaproteobacteria bacterium]